MSTDILKLTNAQIQRLLDAELQAYDNNYYEASGEVARGPAEQDMYTDLAALTAAEIEQRKADNNWNPAKKPPTPAEPVKRRPSQDPLVPQKATGRAALGSDKDKGGPALKSATRLATGGDLDILPPQEGAPDLHVPFSKIAASAKSGGLDVIQFMYSKEPGSGHQWTEQTTDAERKAAKTKDYIEHYKPKGLSEVFKANSALIILISRRMQELQKAVHQYGPKARFATEVTRLDGSQVHTVVGKDTVAVLQAYLESRVKVSEYYFSAKGKREAVVLDEKQRDDLKVESPGKYATLIFRKLGGRAVLTEVARKWVTAEITARKLAVPDLGTDNKYYPQGINARQTLSKGVSADGPMLQNGWTTRAAVNNVIRLSLKANAKKVAKEKVKGVEKEKSVTRYPLSDGVKILLTTVPPSDFGMVKGKKNVKEWFPNAVGSTLAQLMADHYTGVNKRADFDADKGLTSADITSIIPFLTKYKNDPSLDNSQKAYLGEWSDKAHPPAVAEIEYITQVAKGASEGAKALAKALSDAAKATKVKAPAKPRAKTTKKKQTTATLNKK